MSSKFLRAAHLQKQMLIISLCFDAANRVWTEHISWDITHNVTLCFSGSCVMNDGQAHEGWSEKVSDDSSGITQARAVDYRIASF